MSDTEQEYWQMQKGLEEAQQKLAELKAENAILRQFMRTCDLHAAEMALEGKADE